jgi:uncharacterized protein (TIGR03437 family)
MTPDKTIPRRTVLRGLGATLTLPLLLATATRVASAQTCPANEQATYPNPPLTYPMTSNRYAVQYKLGNSANWTDARVYISYYGGSTSSPEIKGIYSADESMSFVSVPAAASTAVALRVTKIFGSNFPAISQMSVRPKAKGIQLSSVNANTVQLSTTTAADFAGDQFILWWDGDTKESSTIQGLALFLDPPYTRPTGTNVKIVKVPADLTGDLSGFDTLDIEGTVAVASTGAQALIVPAHILNIFLGSGAWLQGKLRFTQSGTGNTRKIYGPGVLDVSRFNYMNRHCGGTDDGYQSISWIPLPAKTNGVPSVADGFIVDGPIVTDSDYYATAWFSNSTINNVKIIGWNANNDGLQLGITVRVSNVFIRTSDDSLKMWGSYITVTNATVWQNWNGAPVNLGWFDNSPGDDCLIDGLYVVKMDWFGPPALSWDFDTLNWQNIAVVASVMVPGTSYGALLPSVYRNIYVEDTPRVLFSLKITPSLVGNTGLDLSLPSVLNLNIENVFTPVSTFGNSIGFQNVNGTALTGNMNIGLTNVMLTLPNGSVMPLTNADAASVGKVITNGDHVNITYASMPKATTAPLVPTGAVVNGASFAAGAPVAPGSIASVFGSNFGSSLAGVTVLVGGIVAPLLAVSPQQINFQVPWQLSGQTQAALTVTSGDLTSAPMTVPLAKQAPGIFLLNSAAQAAVLVANTASIAAPAGTFPGSRPAQRGEYLSIFCTGLGGVTHQPATGAPAGGNPVSLTDNGSVAVSIGGVPAPVSFSGLAPGFIGLYQVNVQVPSNSPIGPAVPLIITMGTTTSKPANIAVAAAGM